MNCRPWSTADFDNAGDVLPARHPGLVRKARSDALSPGHSGLPGDTIGGGVRADIHTFIVVHTDSCTDTFVDPVAVGDPENP